MTAPTAANSQPDAANWAPRASDPATGRPWPANPAATAPASSRLAAKTTVRAAAGPAYRPVGAAPSSSRRPASSSARVCRTTVSRLISATITVTMLIRQATRPPGSAVCTGP
ncbi:hypothetical protein [Solwaraspora sp. WMMA2101]|uniref:hypothetical protein n=1 Tax=Solwaraspora sp. WMMA2101 TaxID=3404124 RepID=UPI003B927C84